MAVRERATILGGTGVQPEHAADALSTLKKALLLVASHALVAKARFTGQFRRNLKGSDMLHWGEGTVSVGPAAVSLMGRLAPGPDYKLYFVPDFVQDEAAFLRIKATSLRIGDVKTFDDFIVALPPGVDLADDTTVVVWCETFREFISAAPYR